MSLLCFGISHQTAPLTLLEPLSFNAGEMEPFLRNLCNDNISEAAGLSTCNRTEFYLEAENLEQARESLVAALTERTGTGLSVQIEHSYTHEELAAARHIFRVACGIDSLIVGERQILGQIRSAADLAAQAGSADRILTKLFNKAISTGRRAHVETNIGHGRVSVASVSVTIAQKVFTDFSRKSVLVIGAGQTGKLAAVHFRKAGIGSITVTNRTQSRADALAEEVDGTVVPFSELASALEKADIVACATGSQEHVVTYEMLKVANKRRGGAPMVLLDLSLPRNIDPKIAQMDLAFLYAIEDLEAAAQENRAQREAEISAVEAIVKEEVANFSRWYARSEADLLIVALRRRVEEIRRQHLDRYAADEPEETRAKLDKFTDSLLRSVFHDLMQNLRTLDLTTETGKRDYELICSLFNINSGEKVATTTRKAE